MNDVSYSLMFSQKDEKSVIITFMLFQIVILVFFFVKCKIMHGKESIHYSCYKMLL